VNRKTNLHSSWTTQPSAGYPGRQRGADSGSDSAASCKEASCKDAATTKVTHEGESVLAMSGPEHYRLVRYLEAKKGIDDRALNQAVWQRMAELLRKLQETRSVTILEVGCGIGTMIERMLEQGLLTKAVYTAIDLNPEYVAEAKARLRGYASRQGCETREEAGGTLVLERPGQEIVVNLMASDLFDIAGRDRSNRVYDLILAHAFLDLVDLDAALRKILSLIRPGGLLYFSLNFDGATIFEPRIHPALDRQIEELYHQTMDLRQTGSVPSRMSRTGRRLLVSLTQAGATVVSAGSSDWVIHPRSAGYSPDEAYFLHFIIDMIRGALNGEPDLDQNSLGEWIAERHRQVEKGVLVYIAHQIDVLAQVPEKWNVLDQ
jgi:SAM-dependent methyltransferase